MDSKQIGTVTVDAREWKKNGQHRIYFSGNRGQACWDVNAREWVKVSHEFGPRFKAEIKIAFSL